MNRKKKVIDGLLIGIGIGCFCFWFFNRKIFRDLLNMERILLLYAPIFAAVTYLGIRFCFPILIIQCLATKTTDILGLIIVFWKSYLAVPFFFWYVLWFVLNELALLFFSSEKSISSWFKNERKII